MNRASDRARSTDLDNTGRAPDRRPFGSSVGCVGKPQHPFPTVMELVMQKALGLVAWMAACEYARDFGSGSFLVQGGVGDSRHPAHPPPARDRARRARSSLRAELGSMATIGR